MKKFIDKFKIFGALAVLTSIIVIIITTELLTTKSLSATPVTLSFIPAPNIDVVLAKGKTTTNVNSFKSDLLTSLGELGIDTTKVNISSVSTENVNMQSAFSWNKDLSSSIGSITIENNGQNVKMIGNRKNPGKNAIYIVPSDNQEQKFTFDYNIDYGDSFKAAGMLLKVNKVGDVLTGYMLSFNKVSETYYTVSGSNLGAIWKFSWKIGTNSTSLSCLAQRSTVATNSCVLVKGLNIQQSGQLTVSVDSGYIKISGGGLTTTETILTESSYDGIGFGFFSDHYSHNCDSIGSFALTNINLQKTTVKKLSEVLREPDWRSDAIKVVVNVSDYISDELNNNSTKGELLTRLINEELYFAAWGNSVNQSQFQNLITSNNGNGKFINNTNYNNSISQTAKYIKTLIDQLKGNDNYLILGEPIKISSSPAGVLVNTAGGTYPYGRWKITHNYQYFENDLGQFSRANQYLNNMITEFDKTGEFKITYEDQAITPQSVYVHRRPFAIINHNKTGLTLNLSSASYDLDKYSNNTPLPNGIAQEEWKYKKTTETTWKSGKLTTLEANADYIIQLRVKDLQGAWSAPASVYTTNDASVLPIAYFSIEDDEISKWETLKINDTSYDPYGGKITSRYWEVYKNGTRVHAGSTAKVNGYTETGVYVMKLRVTNDRGKTSEFFSRTFQITDDTTAPSIIINPEKGGWAQYINVKVNFNDSQSGFKSYQYAITDSQIAATTGWSRAITKSSDTIRINTGGNKYLHIKATDNAGNVSDERITGIYYIDVTAPKIIPTQETKTEINKTTVKLTITDLQSGVKSITVDNKNVTSGSVTFTKNGVYTVVATDNAGNVSKMNINVTNVYYHCNAGLGHPDYSSSLDGCPICASYKGLAVTNTSNVYDGNNHRVKYNNPKGATIVEYYNGSKTNVPKKVGNYSYELKVVYNGVEYRTGVTGTYSVTKKTITITGIKSPNKIYDGNDKMTVTNGELVGVCAGDTVGFTLPSVSYAESKNVGNHKIRLGSNIVLTGQDAYNYTLTQPTYGSITGNIVKRTITVSGVQGKTRRYNKTNIMEIIGGTIVNGVEGDDISLNIPKTGTAESANTGNWKIKIDDIVLQGTDAKNYTLIQPEEVRGTIEKEIGVLKINCDSKIYNKEYSVPYVTENNSTARVTYKFYIEGSDEEIEVPRDVGKYEVVGSMISDGNYTEATTERIKFEITQKDITIVDIVVPNKIYNGTKNFSVTGGKLVGVYGGDDVSFSLPYLGYSESKNIGNYKIKLDDITLNGKQANNYHLIQPTYGSITSNIGKKQISTKGIHAENKKYDKNNVVSISGGELVGMVENDDVILKVPTEGTAEKAETGEWIVKIDDVTIEGKDAKNYELIQPEQFKVTIEKADGKIKIGCEGKKFDREKIEPFVIENNSGGNVTFKYYIAGTSTQVEKPSEIGKYDIIATLKETDNYTSYTSERYTVEITDPDSPNLKVESVINTVNGTEIDEIKEVNVHYTDTIKVKIKVKNIGVGSGYLSKVSTTIPKGMELVEDSEINKKYKWTEVDGKLETTMFSFKENFESEIYNKGQDDTEQLIELELELKVIVEDKESANMILPFEIEQQNKHGDIVEYDETSKENSKDEVNAELKYFDVSIDKTITLLSLTYAESGETEDFNIYQRKGSPIKMEVSEMRANSSYAKLKYKITLANNGTGEGTVDKVIDVIPKGTIFEQEDNPDWTLDNDGNAIYNKKITLSENQMKEIEIVLKWDLRSYNLGTRRNQVFFDAPGEIDQILTNEEKITLEKTDNFAYSEMVFSLPTGSESIIYILIAIMIVTTLGVGIVLIKKYVTK